jgi:hypothetical protein
MPQAARIVRCDRVELWGEQPRIRVSVRAIAAERATYSDNVTLAHIFAACTPP